jgi:histidinol-phosphatase (PHP family)
MERSCERALEIGLPAIAFTDHADFVKVHPDQYCVDIAGYLAEVERCRSKFKDLRILSGVELGEPHWFPDETKKILSAGRLDQVLGSVHCVRVRDELYDASQFPSLAAADFNTAVHAYFAETLALVESAQPFAVLSHLDYPKRYWPPSRPPYREQDYEGEVRAILIAAARRGSVLEVNTTRGGGEQKLCPGPVTLRWWREVGGAAVSFGSDAHDPSKVAAGFELAAQVVEAAGFKPAAEPTAYWRR